jgi:curli biogenesis system outer membrane secretion channel CsgG
MKQSSILLLLALLILFNTSTLNAQKTTVEEVTRICDGLDASQKPVVAVMPFRVSVSGADQALGTGLPDMLMNAIFNTGCFRVVERDRLNDIMKEQGLGLSGAGDENSFAQVGKLAGAQVLIFGTITEFTENESGGSAGGVGVFRGLKNRLGIGGAGVTAQKAHLGYTLRFVDPTTGEVLDNKSFNESKTSVGLAGGSFFGTGAAGGKFYKSKSMQDAVEKSLIEAVEYMSKNKSAYTAILNNSNNNKSGANNNTGSKLNKDCPILKAAKKPAIVVIVPEEHVSGEGSNYDPYRHRVDITFNYERDGLDEYISTAPCQAAETAISSELTESGFHLKDATQLEELKKENSFKNAYKNPSDASKIGSRFGVDIIIVGEAFSEYSKKANGLVSCRATLSVKAIMRSDASIIATKSFKGSGLDATELIAGKTALEKAGTQMADYLQIQFCSKSDDIVSSMNIKETDIKEETGSNNLNASYKTSNQSEPVKENVSQKQPEEIDFSGRKSKEVAVTIQGGITYEQSKSLSAAMEKIKGINSVKPSGFTLGYISYKVNTFLSPDELIEGIKKWNPKLSFVVMAATEEAVMLAISNGN